jgi:hypothetical protein
VCACTPLPAPLLSAPKPSTNRRCAFVCCIPICQDQKEVIIKGKKRKTRKGKKKSYKTETTSTPTIKQIVNVYINTKKGKSSDDDGEKKERKKK